MLQSNKEHIEYSDMMMLHIQVKDTKTLKNIENFAQHETFAQHKIRFYLTNHSNSKWKLLSQKMWFAPLKNSNN